MSTIAEQKQDLRNKVLDRRISISKEEWRKLSAAVSNRLKELDVFKEASVVHTYVSMNERNEVDTHPLLHELLASGKEVWVPVTDFDEQVLRHVRLRDYNELSMNKWGVLEPSADKATDLPAADLILVPMSAADRNGNRLGYGKGYYDKFLQHSDALKAGLVFDTFIYEEIPSDHFDIKMDLIISEKDVYRM